MDYTFEESLAGELQMPVQWLNYGHILKQGIRERTYS